MTIRSVSSWRIAAGPQDAPFAGPPFPNRHGDDRVGNAIESISKQLDARAAVLHQHRGQWVLVGSSQPREAARHVAAGNDGPSGRHDWTGILLDRAEADAWLVMVPGSTGEWAQRADLEGLLESLSEELSVISEQRANDYLRRASTRAYVLGRRVMRLPGAEQAYAAVIGAMAAGVRARYGALAVYSRDEGALRIEATHGYPGTIVEHVRLRPGEGLLGSVFATGKPLLVGEDGAADVLPHKLRHRTRSCIIVPLRSGQHVVGAAAVSDPVDGLYFTRADLRALRLFVPPAVCCVQREWLREDLREASTRAMLDPVTGLANRRHLESRLIGEIQRARRLDHSLALMLLDIDDFKRVNDTLGHAAGDGVLRNVAGLLSDNVRVFDLCTRYGGEEFVILMPGADQSVAVQIGERVRKAVENFHRNEVSALAITISVGVSLLGPHDTPESLLGRADDGLRRAKSEGKNALRFTPER